MCGVKCVSCAHGLPASNMYRSSGGLCWLHAPMFVTVYGGSAFVVKQFSLLLLYIV